MSDPRPHILFLPRWYPHRYDPMPGLFVRYQAEALAESCEVSVLYVHPDPHCPNDSETEFAVENGVNVIRVYYLPSAFPPERWRRFYRAHMNGLGLLGHPGPDLVHVHVLTREGVMGYLIARRFRVPFVITEHWSRYFPENDFFRNWMKQRITAFIVKRSSALIAVSGRLKKAMIAKGLDHPVFRIIPNVLDTGRFRLPETEPRLGKMTVVHVSCFEDRSKNITGLLDAVRKAADTRSDFTLRLVGEGPDLERMKSYAESLGLSSGLVVFPGLKEGEELVREYGSACFSVLSSRFETFGTVIAESLACGTPVLATSVGVAPELITGSNGMIVPPGDTEALAAGFLEMLGKCGSYDRRKVRETIGERFSASSIAEQLITVYQQAMKGQHV